MKKLMFLMGCMLLASAASADGRPRNIVTTRDNHQPASGQVMMIQGITSEPAAAAAGEQTITIKWVGDIPNGMMNYPTYQVMYGNLKDGMGTLEDRVDVQVPSEGCDIVLYANAETVFYYLVKRVDPAVDKEVTFDLAEAVNHIGFRPVSESGEPLTWSYGDRSHITTEGNIADGDIMTIVYNEAVGTIHYNAWFGYDKIYDSYVKKDCYCGDLLTNLGENNTDYKIMQTSRYRLKGSDDPLCYGVLFNKIGKEVLESNTPGQLAKYEMTIDKSPAYGEFAHDNETLLNIGLIYGDTYLLGFGTYDIPLEAYYANVSADDNFYCELDMSVVEADYKNTKSPMWVIDREQSVTVAYDPLSSMTGQMYLKDSPLNYIPSDMLQAYGSGPSFMSVFNTMEASGDAGVKIGTFQYGSYGFMDDRRGINDNTTKASATYNGEPLYSNLTPSALNSKMKKWYATNTGQGIVDLTFEDTNYKIAGKTGQVTSTLHIDQTKADNTAPVIYAVAVRDAAGKTGYEFPNNDFTGMTLYVSSVDANRDNQSGKYSYKTAPKSVTVEYRKHGESEFKPLQLTKLSAEANPVNGFLYSADMGGITVDNENGLYDLRITSSDAAGNSICETISPALCIHSTTLGVSDIEMSDDMQPIGTRYYNMFGIMVQEPVNGVYLRVDEYADGTVRSSKVMR